VARRRSGPFANLPEVIVLVTEEGTEMIIHAIALRALYRKLLER